MVRVRSPAGLQDADIVVAADIADRGKLGTAIGRYGEKRNAGIERDRCERFSGEAVCRYSRGQAHYTLRRKAPKLSFGHYKRASALAFGASFSISSGWPYAVLGCNCFVAN